MRHLKHLLFKTLCLATLASCGWGCTAIGFKAGNDAFAGRTFDWTDPQAFLVKIPVGTHQTASALPAGDTPLSWHTKYGAVLLTMASQNKPTIDDVVDGLNTQGLSMAVLELDNADYPTPTKGAPVIGSAQLTALVLSQCGTIACTTNLLKHTVVVPTIYKGNPSPLHYIVRDATGASATIEYLNGHLTLTNNPNWPILTNTPYADARKALHNFIGFGGNTPIPTGFDSLSRFIRATSFLQTMQPQTNTWQALSSGLTLLSDVREPLSSPYPTQWTVMRNQTQKIFYWKTSYDPRLKWIDLKTLSFAAGIPIEDIPLSIDDQGLCNNDFNK